MSARLQRVFRRSVNEGHRAFLRSRSNAPPTSGLHRGSLAIPHRVPHTTSGPPALRLSARARSVRFPLAASRSYDLLLRFIFYFPFYSLVEPLRYNPPHSIKRPTLYSSKLSEYTHSLHLSVSRANALRSRSFLVSLRSFPALPDPLSIVPLST